MGDDTNEFWIGVWISVVLMGCVSFLVYLCVI